MKFYLLNLKKETLKLFENPDNISPVMSGRLIEDYHLMYVNEDGSSNVVKFNSSDISEIQKQIDELQTTSEETPYYVVLFNNINGLECDCLEDVEGDENLRESIISTFNHISNEYYDEGLDVVDIDEIMNSIEIYQKVNKTAIVKEAILEELKNKDDREYKEYLRLQKKFAKK